MMADFRDISRDATNVARSLMARYGDDAQAIAMMRTSELGFSGDMEGYAFWELVLAVLEILDDPETPVRPDA